jgi:hypothetical protein
MRELKKGLEKTVKRNVEELNKAIEPMFKTCLERCTVAIIGQDAWDRLQEHKG